MSANIKYSDEYIRNVCTEKDLSLIDIRYYQMGKRNRRCVCFICNKHQDKGEQILPTEKILNNKKPCQYCNHVKLKETFVEEIEKINPTVEILSKYKNWDTKIHCHCRVCDNDWWTVPSILLYGGGCKICGHKRVWEVRGRKTTDDFKNEMALINPNIEIIGEYIKNKIPIQCRCKIHNHIWSSIPCNLLNGSAKCPLCSMDHIREVEGLSVEDINNRLHIILPHIEIIGNYVNNHTAALFWCNIHNCEFEMKPSSLLYKKAKGCPYCSQSVGEKKLVEILERSGHNIIQQYSFNDCIHKNKLYFDAYDSDDNILYEYQGEQHYRPVDFAGKGQEWANQQFEINQKRDKIKVDYCKDHNIPLVIIPYWEYDNMENFIYK